MAHPRLPEGPCEHYAAGHAALPGKGPAEIRAELIAAGIIPDPDTQHGDHHQRECKSRGCGWIAVAAAERQGL